MKKKTAAVGGNSARGECKAWTSGWLRNYRVEELSRHAFAVICIIAVKCEVPVVDSNTHGRGSESEDEIGRTCIIINAQYFFT